MDEQERQFARRYRRWIDSLVLNGSLAKAVWQKISNALELGQGSPARAGLGGPGRKNGSLTTEEKRKGHYEYYN